MIDRNSDLTNLRRRLLSDLKEIKVNPYPGIELHVLDDLNEACLVLKPEDTLPLHLTLHFTEDYPLKPPHVTIQSKVSHPNVFDNHLCISLLSIAECYTPAYTLKAICIQILSFFNSDKVEQMWGEHGGLVDLKAWQKWGCDGFGEVLIPETYECKKCDFGKTIKHIARVKPSAEGNIDPKITKPGAYSSHPASGTKKEKKSLKDLPNEVLLIICDYLDDETLLLAGGAGGVMSVIGCLINEHNIIRTRELVCFIFKTGFSSSNLGVGVHMNGRNIESEFDLISQSAFNEFNVRRSIHGLPIEMWLPLPLAPKHWARVKTQAESTLNLIARRAGLSGNLDETLYAFMNGAVVRLSAASDDHNWSTRSTHVLSRDGICITSSLTHASEKAIESYFHLFHILLCLAVDHPGIPRDANKLIKDFVDGHRSKDRCPNIGYLLIAILICDIEVTEELLKAIINETITRNVIWMLEARPKGKGMPELSFLETNAISDYRLQKTFDAGRTGYKLLMFLGLMRKVVRSARNDKDGNKMTLEQLRDNLFRRHGAPPNGAAAKIAQDIRAIQKVNNFPQFLANMGMKPPSASIFTTFLRRTVKESVKMGYSKLAITQEQALHLRLAKDPNVQAPEGMKPQSLGDLKLRDITFFPQRAGHGGRGRSAGRGGLSRGLSGS